MTTHSLANVHTASLLWSLTGVAAARLCRLYGSTDRSPTPAKSVSHVIRAHADNHKSCCPPSRNHHLSSPRQIVGAQSP